MSPKCPSATAMLIPDAPVRGEVHGARVVDSPNQAGGNIRQGRPFGAGGTALGERWSGWGNWGGPAALPPPPMRGRRGRGGCGLADLRWLLWDVWLQLVKHVCVHGLGGTRKDGCDNGAAAGCLDLQAQLLQDAGCLRCSRGGRESCSVVVEDTMRTALNPAGKHQIR